MQLNYFSLNIKLLKNLEITINEKVKLYEFFYLIIFICFYLLKIINYHLKFLYVIK